MPPNVQRALAQGAPKHGSLKDIEHVVLLMQENRSFDHYFGTLSGVRGFGDLTSAFRFDDHKAQPPVLPDTSGPLTPSRYEQANLPAPTFPGTGQKPPKQEPGGRPRVPRH